MANINEKQIEMSGRLGQYYALNIRTKVEKEDLSNNLDIRARLIKSPEIINPEDEKNILIEGAVLRLYINDTPVYKTTVDLDFIHNDNIVLGNYNVDINSKETLNLKIRAELIVEDKSKYLQTTGLGTVVTIAPILEDRLYIDIDMTEKPNTLYFTVLPTIKADRLEYKVNELDWKELDANYFEIAKIGKNQYVQVRGKKNNYYSYSNVIKYIEHEND